MENVLKNSSTIPGFSGRRVGSCIFPQGDRILVVDFGDKQPLYSVVEFWKNDIRDVFPPLQENLCVHCVRDWRYWFRLIEYSVQVFDQKLCTLNCSRVLQ